MLREHEFLRIQNQTGRLGRRTARGKQVIGIALATGEMFRRIRMQIFWIGVKAIVIVNAASSR